MTARAAIAFAALHFEDDNLVPALVFKNFSRNACARNRRRADLGVFAFACEDKGDSGLLPEGGGLPH